METINISTEIDKTHEYFPDALRSCEINGEKEGGDVMALKKYNYELRKHLQNAGRFAHRKEEGQKQRNHVTSHD